VATLTSRFSTYGTLEPWFVALAMVTNMAPSGVVPKMWLCPTRKGWSEVDAYYRFRNNGASIGSAQDLHASYARLSKAPIAFPDMCWWVPRALEGSTNVYPDPKVVVCRSPEPWPVTMEDPSSAIQPIASDRAMGGWDPDRKVAVSPGQGRSFAGRLRSCNAAFADGRVEPHSSSAIEWQIVSDPGDHGLLY
jgi:prepilin-type processing-associated H-X9-DG protein